MKHLVKLDNNLKYVDECTDECLFCISDELMRDGHKIEYNFDTKKFEVKPLREQKKKKRK